MARLPILEETCSFCGETGPAMRYAELGAKRARRSASLCVWCLLDAAERLTGFGFVNQAAQWFRMRGAVSLKAIQQEERAERALRTSAKPGTRRGKVGS